MEICIAAPGLPSLETKSPPFDPSSWSRLVETGGSGTGLFPITPVLRSTSWLSKHVKSVGCLVKPCFKAQSDRQIFFG